MIRVGTAGWSISGANASEFPGEGSQLERYAARLPCVEINTSFYRPHRPATYARWAASAPEDFRFSVKAPRAITHEARLTGARDALAAFLDEIAALGPKLGVVLVQLPPSLAFDESVAARFFADLRARHSGAVACEPRHASWFADPAEALLNRFEIARVAADPPPAPHADAPGGARVLRYWRLHGSPRMYHSAYGEARLAELSSQLAAGDWCVFDNTASGAALPDALALLALQRRK